MLGRVRRHSFPCVVAPIGPLRLPRRMPAQTLVSLVFGLRCPHRAHGYPRLLGHLLRARRVPRPRQVHLPPCAIGWWSMPWSSSSGMPWTLGNVPFSRLTSHGSLVRVPTHRPARCRPASTLSPTCPAQGSLPTCLAGLIGRDSHPLDDASVFLEVRRTFLSLRTNIAWSHLLWGFMIDCLESGKANPRARALLSTSQGCRARPKVGHYLRAHLGE